MQFYDVWTTYNAVGKQTYGKDWPRYFYDMMVKKIPYEPIDRGRVTREGLFSEFTWFKHHKIYYQVWPGIVDEFIKTRIDINASLLKAPHKVFAIKMPKTENPILSFNNENDIYTIESIIVWHEFDEEEQKRVVYWRIAYGKDKYSNPGTILYRLYLSDDKTIEECLGKHFYEVEGIDIENKPFHISASVQDACLRLIVAVHFLATGSHKVLEFDVLSKHLEAYRRLEGNNPKCNFYERIARNKGKFGWNIGRGMENRALKLPRGVSYEEAVKNAGGRELLYQHVRGGHWHSYRYGKGREYVKIVWLDATTIRKDLPPKALKL